jgi:hypothetical protein
MDGIQGRGAQLGGIARVFYPTQYSINNILWGKIS